MKQVTIGMVGAGRAAQIHLDALKYVHGIDIRYKTVMARRSEQIIPFKDKYSFENAVYDFDEILKDKDIDIVHICTPPYAHEEQVKKALSAGKNVICEKPFIGYFGDGTSDLAGFGLKENMYKDVLLRLEDMKRCVKESGMKFMYADNAVYAPSVKRASEFIMAKKSKILFMKGEESLKGSSSPAAGEWSKTGGGTFIRNAAHPLTAILWLKKCEAAARNEVIGVKSVLADMTTVSVNLTEYEHRHIDACPHDVEDIGTAIVTFTDGSKAVIMATNIFLGGLRDYIELYCNDATFKCNLTMNDTMSTYFLDNDGIENMKISELCSSKLGWNQTFVSDEVLRGYIGEMQDFYESVCFDREPVGNIDLACDATKIIYAAYLSAERKSMIEL